MSLCSDLATMVLISVVAGHKTFTLENEPIIFGASAHPGNYHSLTRIES